MAWTKRTTPLPPVEPETPDEPIESAAPSPDAPDESASAVSDSAAPTAETGTPPAPAIPSPKEGDTARRGMAVLGLVVLIFAVIGLISTTIFGFRIVRQARDTSGMEEELYYALLPLMQYAPTAFEDPNASNQDALIQAALYKITNQEWIRQQQNSEYQSPYETDEFGRTLIPVADVQTAYAALFGDDAEPYLHTFGDDAGSYFTYEYNTDTQLYYVPYSTTASAYEPVIRAVHRAKNIYRVEVGYVHLQDITVNDYGNQVVDVQKATYFQIYTVEQQEDGRLIIRSVADMPSETKS